MDPRRPHRPPGAALVELSPGSPSRRCLARGADLVLVVLTGAVEVGVGPAVPTLSPAGAVAVCPRGVPWSLRPGPDGARVVVVAFPGGSEEAVGAVLRDRGQDDAALVAVAADGGLELVLSPAPG
jgi:hypothetical protein